MQFFSANLDATQNELWPNRNSHYKIVFWNSDKFFVNGQINTSMSLCEYKKFPIYPNVFQEVLARKLLRKEPTLFPYGLSQVTLTFIIDNVEWINTVIWHSFPPGMRSISFDWSVIISYMWCQNSDKQKRNRHGYLCAWVGVWKSFPRVLRKLSDEVSISPRKGVHHMNCSLVNCIWNSKPHFSIQLTTYLRHSGLFFFIRNYTIQKNHHSDRLYNSHGIASWLIY